MLTENVWFLFLLAFLTLILTWSVIWLTGPTGTGDKIIREAKREQAENPDKTYPRYKEAYGYLWKHIDANLGQSRWIFWLTLVLIFAGFVMIGYGIITFGAKPTNLLSNQSFPPIAAGVITEFIAATILVVYRSVFRQTSSHFLTLERLTAIGVSIQLLDEIANDPTTAELASHSKAEFAKLLLQLQHGKVAPDKAVKD